MTDDELESVLRWAESVRAARQRLVGDLGAGTLGLEDCLLAAPDEPWGPTTLRVVLEALPGARRIDTRRRLAELGVDGDAAVEGLSAHDAERVLATFPLGTQGPTPEREHLGGPG